MAILDLRRTDLRSQTLANPVVLTSAAITKECDDAEAVLFSFPKTGLIFVIENMILEVKTAFAGGTPVLLIGNGTLATDAITTGGAITVVDADEYFATAVALPAAAGIKRPTAGDFFTARAANNVVNTITGAATTVPAIYATLTSDDVLTAGEARLHVLGYYLPNT